MRLALLFSEHSHQPFRLADRTGAAFIRPSGVRADLGRPSYEAFLPDETADPASVRIGPDREHEHSPDQMLFSAGHTYKEWTLAPGARVLVTGSVERDGADTAVVAPPGADMVLSRRTAPQIERARRRREAWGFLFLPAAVMTALLVSCE